MLSLKHAKSVVLSGAAVAAIAAGCSSQEKQPSDAFAAAAPTGGEFENSAEGPVASADAFPPATPSDRARMPNQSAIIRDPWREYTAMRDKLGR